MKKTIFSLLLVVALVAALAVPALADTPVDVYHCECGAKWYASADEATPSVKNGTCVKGCEGENLTWKPMTAQPCEMIPGQWVDANSKAEWVPSGDYNFYLVGNLETTYKLKIGDTTKGAPEGSRIRIDLNGFDYDRTKNTVFQITGASHLVITDTSANKTGRIFGKENTAAGQDIIQINSGSVKQYAGTIDGQYIAAKGTQIDTDNTTNVRVDGKGTYYMYNGAIVNGKYKTGGNVIIKGAFYMYDGTIKDGSTTGGSNKHAGNIRISDGGDFYMSGGVVRDGNAVGGNDEYKSKAGNIMATGAGSTVNISGNAQILGGTAYDPTTNSVWINTGAELNVSGGRIEKEILIVGTAKVSGGQFDTTDMSKYFQLTSNMTLIGDLGVAGETLTLTEDTYIDLNGHNILSNIDTGDFTLYLSDSATADYDVKDGKYGKVTGEIKGKVARDYVNGSKQRYLVVKTADGYSAHRIYMAVTNSIIDGTNNGGMKYTTVLKCDEVVAGLIADYGVVFNGETASYYGANETCTIGAWDGTNMNEKVTKVFEILKSGAEGNAAAAETAYAVKAYITLNDTFGDEFKTVNSAAKERSMQEMIVKAVADWNNLTAEQQATLKAIYATFNNGAYMDDKSKWPNVADKLK